MGGGADCGGGGGVVASVGAGDGLGASCGGGVVCVRVRWLCGVAIGDNIAMGKYFAACLHT